GDRLRGADAARDEDRGACAGLSGGPGRSNRKRRGSGRRDEEREGERERDAHTERGQQEEETDGPGDPTGQDEDHRLPRLTRRRRAVSEPASDAETDEAAARHETWQHRDDDRRRKAEIGRA